MIKIILVLILFIFVSCKEKRYRVEVYTKIGKVEHGTMWHDMKRNGNTYSNKLDSQLSKNIGIDSIAIIIVEQ